jgi:hypothetical protein
MATAPARARRSARILGTRFHVRGHDHADRLVPGGNAAVMRLEIDVVVIVIQIRVIAVTEPLQGDVQVIGIVVTILDVAVVPRPFISGTIIAASLTSFSIISASIVSLAVVSAAVVRG